MRLLAKMWLELREPLTVLFALALPLVVLFVMGGVFGNDSTPEVYRGVGAMDYYVPAYMALVAASVGLISLPTHIASDRERGVLKRYRASGVPAWVLVGAQTVGTLAIAVGSGIVLISVAMPTYDVVAPDSALMVMAGFVLVALAFAAIGVLFGAVLPSARAAQALGVLLWFVLLILGAPGRHRRFSPAPWGRSVTCHCSARRLRSCKTAGLASIPVSHGSSLLVSRWSPVCWRFGCFDGNNWRRQP